VAEQLAASQEGVSSTKLITFKPLKALLKYFHNKDSFYLEGLKQHTT
jgi:hypothetical protein